MIKIYKNKELKAIIEKELREACELVIKRANIFKEEAKEFDLKSYPFSGGFFITVHCEDGIKVAEELKKEKVYVLGLKKAIRIAICSIPTFEVKGLASKISKVINRL
jgi:aspartate/tyrosine/aromatic aminotransferase